MTTKFLLDQRNAIVNFAETAPAVASPQMEPAHLLNETPMLLAYCMTGSDVHVRRMARSLSEQARLNSILGTRSLFNRVLFTDADPTTLPEIITKSVEQIRHCDPYVYDRSGGKFFCLSKFRNASIDFGNVGAYEWMMLCDSDTIIVDDSNFKPPSSGFGIPKVYWQKRQDESVQESLEVVRSSGEVVFSPGNSWFILSSVVMSRFRFNENIYGYGFEDVEFATRLRSAGFDLQGTNLVVIHSFHPPEEKNIVGQLWDRNKSIFEATKLLIAMGKDVAECHRISVVDASHPHWKSKLALVADQNLLVHMQHKSEASYELSDDNLVVSWKEFPKEVYIREVDGTYVKKQHLYSPEWYRDQTIGSLASAREVLPFVFDVFHPQSVCDFGCGSGAWLVVAKELGAGRVLGVDGPHVEGESLLVQQQEFLRHTFEESLELDLRFDLALSLEVAEHLQPASADRLIASLVNAAPVILFSAAIPEQGGTGHINEQWASYWIRKFEAHDFYAFDAIRPFFWDNPRVQWWYSQNSFLFIAGARAVRYPALASARKYSSSPFINLVHPSRFLHGRYQR